MRDYIKDLLRLSPKKLILSFINIKDNSHIGISHTGNQILVCMKSGEFRLFQSGVVTKDIDKMLGVNRANVRYWTVLPTRKSPQHPLHDPHKVYGNDTRYEDIFV
jgi:hypothetical protein